MAGRLLFAVCLLFLLLPVGLLPVLARADCLTENPDLYRLHPQDPRYAPLAFAYCARVKRECPTDLDQLLEQLRWQDPPVYDYLSGVALASGECTRRSLAEAENHLQRCARYSQTCKKTLLLLASLDPKNKRKYWGLANEVVRTGSVYGMIYLIEYHASLNTAHDDEQALYWLEIARIGSEIAVNRLRRQAADPDYVARLLDRQQNFQTRLAQRAAPILKKLNQAAISRARSNAVTWHKRNAEFFRRQRQGKDPVAWLASIYNLKLPFLKPPASPASKPPARVEEKRLVPEKKVTPEKKAAEKAGKKEAQARPSAPAPAQGREKQADKQPEKLREYEKIIDDLVM